MDRTDRMLKIFGLIFFIPLIWIFISSPRLIHFSPTYGRVIDTNNYPIANAKVEIKYICYYQMNSSSVVGKNYVFSDKLGKFYFKPPFLSPAIGQCMKKISAYSQLYKSSDKLLNQNTENSPDIILNSLIR